MAGQGPSKTPALTERFDLLAKEKGWTEEKLRQSYDMPKKQMPPGVPVIRIPAELLEDPFVNKQPMSAEEEYNIAEAQFLSRVKNVKIVDKTAGARSKATRSVRVTTTSKAAPGKKAK